ncbi:methyltransferase family protein [Taibaiella koreensis]|uniref:methyltransferase family protein n=1 Tax=Taibaiella koreensis TaxID=1268548 RepID=UPI000E59BDD6|nr:isoprenylcysteine carboxylmethyltransferase family protein [Taibaiella koreensis]
MTFLVQHFIHVFGFLFLLMELYLNVRFRNKAERKTAADRNSLRLLWITIAVALVLGGYCSHFNDASITQGQPYVYYGGMILAVAGLLLRILAISQLGKSFTVDVQIAEGQQLRTTGLYAYMRHPSYTGILMAFSGLAITFSNWISLAVILVPIFWVFMYRIRVEEEALLAEFGPAYAAYCKRTRRLVPYLF